MGAVGLKARFVFNQGTLGFAEIFVLPGASSFSVAQTKATNLMKARLATCGFGVKAKGLVISKLGAVREFVTITGKQFLSNNPTASTYPAFGGNVPNDADIAKTCIQNLMASGTTRRKQHFMAGVPDAVITTNPEGPDFALIPAYLTVYNTWKNLLINDGWGFVAQAAEAGNFTRRPILSVALEVNTDYLIVETGGVAAGLIKDADVLVRGNTRTSSAFKSMNGRWVVKAVSEAGGSTFTTLRGTAGIDTSQFKKLGTLTLYDTQAYTIDTIQPVRETAHKRGNRFLEPVGRRRRRAFL